ncbi:MAG TPA: metalloregulator ArsR/SmtB family transcription factor [Flavisolibacter sp.]|jgi:DNA-binding transcriptional ArsR family regulator|nr:metalloregulator ArsR/SmtB family transcription factor [Flavisolibacter sp.]
MSKALPVDTHLLQKAALVYRAINHPIRLKILRHLHQEGRSSVTPIYTSLKLLQSVASQQLAILRRAGLVETEKVGKQVYYSVAYDKLTDLHTAAALLAAKKGGNKSQ